MTDLNSPNDFEVRVPGKWIIAGEHSVLRGQKAIALPLPIEKYALTLRCKSRPISTSNIYKRRAKLEALCFTLLNRAAVLLGRSSKDFESHILNWGDVSVESTIPIGSGFGSTAALCVAVVRLLKQFNLFEENSEWTECRLATELEHMFHGSSSGLDVTVISKNRPIFFKKGECPQVLDAIHSFPFEFLDTGLRGKTIEAIRQVQSWIEQNPDQAPEVDGQMGQAVSLAYQALTSADVDQGIRNQLIERSFSLSYDCFIKWGLVPPECIKHKDLLTKDYRAVRMTGAGLGGFWVCLK